MVNVPWHIHMCAMTLSRACRDSFVRSTWLICMCAMIHSCVPWLIHVFAKTHWRVYRDSCEIGKPTGVGQQFPFYCNTLQHTAPLYNTLQYTAMTHLRVPWLMCDGQTEVVRQQSLSHCDALPHAATHCNTLQHIVTHCNDFIRDGQIDRCSQTIPRSLA